MTVRREHALSCLSAMYPNPVKETFHPLLSCTRVKSENSYVVYHKRKKYSARRNYIRADCLKIINRSVIESKWAATAQPEAFRSSYIHQSSSAIYLRNAGDVNCRRLAGVMYLCALDSAESSTSALNGAEGSTATLDSAEGSASTLDSAESSASALDSAESTAASLRCGWRHVCLVVLSGRLVMYCYEQVNKEFVSELIMVSKFHVPVAAPMSSWHVSIS
ncbi:uncharacterized protein RAG0_05474 [Rhynchosporium agropyri]|uniref:Uncharacterized protein n=1 Tax=Rhynchosporium agropyri TaxID=914238 RepID=A0A1E1KD99_9HELO|nr:uncharacterized protein RAG0_05474 [Rhynchosporium agropyri]